MKGWPLHKLSDVCIVRRGTTITQKEARDGAVPVVGGGTIPTYYHDTANRPAGTITISGSGASAGFVNRYSVPIFASDCSTVQPRDETSLLPDFLYPFLQSKQEWINAELRQGAAQPHVYASDIGQIVIPLPPIDEQRRVLSILDKALDHITVSTTNAKKALIEARAITDSYLSAVFPIGRELSPSKPLESICFITNGYAFKSCDFSPKNSVKCIKITNVGVGKFVNEFNSFLPKEFLDKHKFLSVRAGSIVLALTRTIIAGGVKVAVVPNECDGALLNQRVASVQAKASFDRDFIFAYLSSRATAAYIAARVNTLMQPNLSIADLRAMPIPVPERDQQRDIGNSLRGFRSSTRLMEDIYQQKVAALAELKQSLLQRAFTGALA